MQASHTSNAEQRCQSKCDASPPTRHPLTQRRHGFLTAKAIGNRIKAKGLLKLKHYCQLCQKQCRDDNGFKCHMDSESHKQQVKLFAENQGKYMGNYSGDFKSGFLRLLSHRHGTKRVLANSVYQDYIADKDHVHMNATHWKTLTQFICHLHAAGIVVADETERGWYIEWIDTSPGALERQQAAAKRERTLLDEEDREQRGLCEQIARARAAAAAAAATAPSTAVVPGGEDAGDKVVVKFSLLSKTTTTSATSAPPVTEPSSADVAPEAVDLPVHEEGPAIEPVEPASHKRKAEEEATSERKDEKKRKKKKRKDYWLKPGIVVKIEQKDLAGGKYFKQKGVGYIFLHCHG